MNVQDGFGFMQQGRQAGWSMMPAGYPWTPMPIAPQMQQSQVQQSQRQQYTVQQPRQEFDFIRVNSYEDIKEFYVQPNGRVWFMFQDEPIMAFKFANEMGLTDTKFFKFQEFEPSDNAQNQGQAVAVNIDDNRIKLLEGRIGAIEGQLNALKQIGVDVNAEPAKQVLPAEHANHITTAAVQPTDKR